MQPHLHQSAARTGENSLKEGAAVTTLALVYLRVSTKRQLDTAVDIDPDGLSIATQRDECLAKAAQIGAQIVREPFIEPGNSAKTINDRPVFRELLAYVREHPGIKYLITYNRARAFRNHFDAAIVQVQLKKLGFASSQ